MVDHVCKVETSCCFALRKAGSQNINEFDNSLHFFHFLGTTKQVVFLDG